MIKYQEEGENLLSIVDESGRSICNGNVKKDEAEDYAFVGREKIETTF